MQIDREARAALERIKEASSKCLGANIVHVRHITAELTNFLAMTEEKPPYHVTAVRPPTEADGDAYGHVLQFNIDPGNPAWDTLDWFEVADDPRRFPYWQPMPPLPPKSDPDEAAFEALKATLGGPMGLTDFGKAIAREVWQAALAHARK